MSLQAAAITDEQVLNLLRAGEKKGLELLFQRYYDSLVRFAIPILKDEDMARDTVQEVFVRIWNRRLELQINTQLKAYLYMAVKNQSLNLLKKDERIRWMEDAAEMESLGASAETTMNQVVENDLQRRLQKAMDVIPPKCRQVFQLSRFEGKSYQEIAEILGISVKTVENQMGKALQILRIQLLPYLKTLVLFLFWPS